MPGQAAVHRKRGVGQHPEDIPAVHRAEMPRQIKPEELLYLRHARPDKPAQLTPYIGPGGEPVDVGRLEPGICNGRQARIQGQLE